MNMNTNKIDFTQRNQAIDILRALTVLLMILVNDFWSVRNIPEWMKHAASGVDFLGLADVVYPIFLFVVGMSIPFAIESRFRKGLSGESTVLHIFARTFALLIMGAFTEQSLSTFAPDVVPYSKPIFKMLFVVGFFMIWNVYPKTDNTTRKRIYTIIQIAGVLLLCYLAYNFRSAGRDGAVGFFRGSYGILGGIGWAYIVCAFVYLIVRNNLKKICIFWVVFLVLSMLRSRMIGGTQLMPGQTQLLTDLLSAAHVSNNTTMTMGGVLATLLIVRWTNLDVKKQLIYFVSFIVGLFIVALITHKFWIAAKLGMTPSCMLYCSTIAIAIYGLLHWAVVSGKAKWFNIIKAGGTATLSCYVMPYFLQSVFHSYIPIFTRNNYYGFIDSILPELMKTETVYMYCGLIKCFVWALLCILFTALLERFKIRLKI